MTEQTPTPSAEAFDIFEFQSGVAYPSDSVTIYLDQASAYEAQRLDTQIADTKDPDEVDRLVAERQGVLERVKASAITFHLQGLSPEVAQALDQRIRTESALYEASQEVGIQGLQAREDFQDEKFNKRLAAHLKYISRVNPETGAVQEDRREWTAETVDRVLRRLPVEERLKIANLMLDLTYRADYFSELGSDPDFS